MSTKRQKAIFDDLTKNQISTLVSIMMGKDKNLHVHVLWSLIQRGLIEKKRVMIEQEVVKTNYIIPLEIHDAFCQWVARK